MASTSSSSTSAQTHYKYDIFLSFRGEDTRYSFTDHLYKALHQAGIRTFRDDDEIREGHELKPEIERSIKESRASVIVFSENFANSRWCLDELWLILEQKRNCNHFVLPVFYGVDPSDVRNQRGSFCIEAKDGAEGSKWTEDNVKRWKKALREVADLKGTVVSGYETIFIPNIVKRIHSELGLKLYTTPIGLIGVETRAEDFASWLTSKEHDHPVLAICGMGGSGKTTLAKHIYYSNKQNFDKSSLLEDIEKQPDGLFGVQRKLLHDISGNNNMKFSNVYEGAFQLEKAIQMNRVLIVVDDVDDKDQLSILFGTKVFPTQSKIIITTRLLKIDTWVGSISHGCQVRKIELLNNHESLGLLSYHAFGSQIPMKGFEELAVQLAQYCEGNPLALKVLGSSLSETEGTRSEMWRSTMKSLNSLKGDLDQKIQGVLQKSFDTLPRESHKELFLHIACLFLDRRVDHVERILEDDYHAKSGMVTLTNRCLLTMSRNGVRLTMHKLLQDMARKIVRNKSNNPAKHRIVWRDDECCSLLRNGDGSDTIEGLEFMLNAKQGRSEAFKTSSLVKMKNLKYLLLDSVKLTGSYKNFPQLRWLRWQRCNLKTLPPGLFMSSLVAINMNYGDLVKFEPPMVLNSLKVLDLSYSNKLVSVRSLHKLPKLEILDLHNCTRLTRVCKTIGDLKNLAFLSLGECIEFWKASSNQKLVNQLERLKVLFIYGGVLEQPSFPLPRSLSTLSLFGNEFDMLPSYIDYKLLRKLYLTNCPNLKSLPCLPNTLKSLQVDWCTSLENIKFQSGRFTLGKFTYDGCFKLCEIEGLFKLVPIATLDEVDMGHMQWIKAYQDCKVNLVGDVITRDRSFNIQMLYEYGIRSSYLQGVKDQSMATYEYKSSSGFLSFYVPSHPKKHMIKGLNVMFLYRSSSEYKDILPLFVKINNRTKGATWVYNPVVYCKPIVDSDVVWLSSWPIKNIFDTGDEVHVSIIVDKGVIVGECGASLVYMDDGEVQKEEKCGRLKEVIGGDLSFFEVTQGGYYLCRRDLFNSMIPDWLFGDNIHITDSQRWRSSHQLFFNEDLNNFQNLSRKNLKVTLGVNFNSESETDRIENAVSSIEGVEFVSAYEDPRGLIVCGRFDVQAVVMCVRKFEKMVQVLNFMSV